MVLLAAAFLVVEVMCFYFYSWLWLVDGHPDYISQSTVNSLAWVCILTALIAPFVVGYIAVRLKRRRI